MRGTDRKRARRAQWYGTIATGAAIGLLATACGGSAPSPAAAKASASAAAAASAKAHAALLRRWRTVAHAVPTCGLCHAQ